MSVQICYFLTRRGPDDDLKLHLEAISKLDPSEKKTVKELLEGMLLKHEAKKSALFKNNQPKDHYDNILCTLSAVNNIPGLN